MKRSLIILISALVISASGAKADITDKSIDFKEGYIRLGGTAPSNSGNISVVVMNPGFTDEDILNNNAVQYQRVFSVSDGKYSVKIPINTENISGGYFTVYIGGDGFSKSDTTSLYYSTPSERDELIKKINSADAPLLAKYLKDYAEAFSLTGELYDNASLENAAEMLSVHLKLNPATKDDFQSKVNLFCLLDAYNSGKNDICFEDTSVRYDELLGIAGTKTYEIYKNVLNDSGKRLVLSQMKSIKSPEEYYKRLSCGVTVYGIKNAALDGYSHVRQILENGAENGLLNLTAYNMLSENAKLKADASLMTASFEDIPSLASALDIAVRNAGNSGVNSGSGNSGGGGGSSASSGSVLSPGGGSVTEHENNRIFTDIESSIWAKPYIEELWKRGIVSGTSEGKFSPEEYVTREQMAKMLCIALQLDISLNNYFTDVQSGEWYAPYINSLHENGIINGISEDLFGLGMYISRQDAAVMIGRAAGMGEVKKCEFSDFDYIDDYAKDAVSFLTEKGAISGFPDGSFRPEEKCTRAQMAKILCAAFDFYGQQK